ncbi:hypothetical protein PENSPDRAFT_748480 [Peniophora sp. CONT]|nr:hypothetical protein PENSPDRAFT_748480 [Peniophora sp. CONT]
MFSLHTSLTGFVARLLRVVQRPARFATDDIMIHTTGELSSIELTHRSNTQTFAIEESVVHISNDPSSLPTTPAPAYTSRATFERPEYQDILGAGLFVQSMVPKYSETPANPVSVPGSTRRSLVRWNGRNVANDVEMQLPVQLNERPPTYVEVDAMAASQVPPRRRGVLRMSLVLTLSAIVACAITVAVMKKAHAF